MQNMLVERVMEMNETIQRMFADPPKGAEPSSYIAPAAVAGQMT